MGRQRVQLCIRFGYAGDRFSGVQPQPGWPTAGGALLQRLEQAFGGRPKALCFTARTDKGVHAAANVATCWYPQPQATCEASLVDLCRPRNDGLFGLWAERVSTKVHARALARGKRYRYVIEDGVPVGTSNNPYAWQVVPRLDGERMREAATHLLGRHDFSAFRAPRCSAATALKHLWRLDVHGPQGSAVGGTRRFVLRFEADAYVRKMIRIIVGTLAEVGAGLRHPDEMRDILASRRRSAAGVAAPARGLTLVSLVSLS